MHRSARGKLERRAEQIVPRPFLTIVAQPDQVLDSPIWQPGVHQHRLPAIQRFRPESLQRHRLLQRDIARNRLWLFVTAMLGATFVGGQVYEFTTFYHEGLGYTTNLFGSAFYTMTGFHGIHVTVGIVMLMSLVIKSLRGNLTKENAETVEIVGLYWHFVDIVWILIFTVVYLIEVS